MHIWSIFGVNKMKTKLLLAITSISVVTAVSAVVFAVTSKVEKPSEVKETKQVEQKANQSYMRSGSIICTNPMSFVKVASLERVNMQYAKLPDDCDTVGVDIPVNILKSMQVPIAGSVYLVGNQYGTVYIRIRDIRMQ